MTSRNDELEREDKRFWNAALWCFALFVLAWVVLEIVSAADGWDTWSTAPTSTTVVVVVTNATR